MTRPCNIKINVAETCSTPSKQVWLRIGLPDGSTVIDAIEESGVLDMFPEIDLENQKVGFYGNNLYLPDWLIRSYVGQPPSSHGTG